MDKVKIRKKMGHIKYPGSTIQQNYGEDPGKGFLFWEINDRDTFKSTFHEIPHDRPYVTINWTGQFTDTIESAKKYPNHSRFRIKTQNPISQSEIKHLYTALKENVNASEIVFKHEYVTTNKIDPSENEENRDLRNIKTHQKMFSNLYDNAQLNKETKKEVDNLLQKYFQHATKINMPRNIKWSLLELNFENMFAYGKNNKIDFSKISGITGLFGKNRSGKSSIPGTIMFTLFNSTDRGSIKNLHIINMRKGFCLASAKIVANGRYYLVERQAVRKTSKSGVESATTSLNVSEIDKNDNIIKDLNGEQRRETDKILRSIVGTPEDFLMTSLASQGDMTSFIKMKSTKRRSILAKFLDLNIFEDMYTNSKTDSLELKGRLSGVPDRNWNEVITETSMLITNETNKKNDLEVNLAKKRETLDEIKINLATFSKNDLITPDELKQFLVKIDDIKKELDDSENLIKDYALNIDQTKARLDIIDTIKKQFPINDIADKLSEQQVLEGHVISIEALLEKEKTVLKNQENSIKILTQVPCHDQFPDCKFIRDSHKNKKKIEKQSQEITNIKSEMSLLKSSLRKLKKRSLEDKIKKYNEILLQESVIQKQFGDKNLLLSNEKNKKDALSFRLDTMSANCESMKLRVSNSSEASRISKCRKAIEKIENEIIDIDVERISCAEKISRALLSIENLEKEKETYHSLLNQWRAYDFFTSAVSSRGIPMTIIDDRLPIINDEISKILQGVTGFTVELDAPKFSNSMEIYINYGDSRRIIECASGMEKLMASLAIRVALINVSNLPKTSMLIIDEGFGALDDTNIEACSRLLESLKKWFKHIVVISHVDAVKDIADGILEISKIGKDSFITNV